MSEIIVKLTGSRIKLKGGEYVRDLVRCRDCKWFGESVQGTGLCSLGGEELEWANANTMYADDYCSYGERKE